MLQIKDVIWGLDFKCPIVYNIKDESKTTIVYKTIYESRTVSDTTE